MGFFKGSLNLVQTTIFVNKWRHGRVFLAILFPLLLLQPISSPAKSKAPSPKSAARLAVLVKTGGYAVTSGDRLLLGHNLDLPLVPASTAKLVTSLAALKILGPGYRFRTEIYQDRDDNLYLKGYGDPFLVSEEIAALVTELRQSGVTTINSIYIDESAFALEEAGVDGQDGTLNPYDVGPAALVVNFNTISLRVATKGQVESAEPQTPLLPLMIELGSRLPVGEHRINVTINPAHPPLLTGQLFRAFQHQAGIVGSGEYGRRMTPPGARLLLVHHCGRDLTELVRGLLEFSNNFTANQIFLALGAEKFGYPATWGKSRLAMADFLDHDPLLAQGIKLEEGSGLSRRNRVTVRAMLRVLELFRDYAGLLAEKEQCLLKSGTLYGVYAYAGYLPCPNGRDRIVIILNQERNNRDEVLGVLWGIYEEATGTKRDEAR